MNAKSQRTTAGFTLVELLVVIVIIGMLVALISAAAAVAMGRANETVVKIELDNISQAFQAYKNKYGSYPPNFSDQAAIVRHLKRAFPRHLEFPETIDALSPLGAPADALTPAEAVVFWLGGFSSDPEHPLTGPGGPLARPLDVTTSNIDDRTFDFEFDKTRLTIGREIDVLDDDTTGKLNPYPVLVYTYHPKNLNEPYVYFDTSRGKFDALPDFNTDAPNTELTYWPIYRVPGVTKGVVRALVNLDVATGQYEFMNPKSFQVLSAGTDDEWSLTPGETGWNTIWYQGSNYAQYDNIGVPPSFPDGPYIGPLADNLVNFSPRNLENSQP